MEDRIVERYALDVDNFHHVQRDILARLYTKDALPYAGLKPPELTGNSFNYHLRHVLGQGLVLQTSDGNYRLSPSGRLLLDSVSLETMRLKIRPIAGVSLLVRAKSGAVLLYRSKRQPLRGYAGLPFGKLRLGDSWEGTVSRMLRKRGLVEGISGVRMLGSANVRYFDGGELVSHRSASVWVADYAGEEVPAMTDHGESEWVMDVAADKVLPEVDVMTHWPEDQPAVEIAADLA